MVPLPNRDEELKLWLNGYDYVIGMDEVGRGSFAGPVVAAGVIFPKPFVDTKGIHDSKLLTAEKRRLLYSYICDNALAYCIAEVSVPVINEIGILKATHQAFNEIIKSLRRKVDQTKCFILIDGLPVTSLICGINRQKAIIKGDQKSLSIAAASVIAKVHRDSVMTQLDALYPQYQFAQNKGYGTRTHREAIRTYGLSNIHRTSFDLSRYLS